MAQDDREQHDGLRGDGGTLSGADDVCQAPLIVAVRDAVAKMTALADEAAKPFRDRRPGRSTYADRLREVAGLIVEISRRE